MSSINTISSGTPIIPQPATNTGSAGTIPATAGQAGEVRPQGSGQPMPPDQLQKAVERMNQHLAGSEQSVRIGYASSIHRLTVEVVDNSTGQVVGQFPSKAAIANDIAMNKYIGLIVNKEA